MLGRYILNRFLQMIAVLLVVSVISFVVIKLPPGDFLTVRKAELESRHASEAQTLAELELLRERYGLDQPDYVQYLTWVSGILKGDFGYSFAKRDRIGALIGRRIVLTMVVATLSIAFSIILAVPIGAYSALRQYSAGDYFFTLLGFLGLSLPNFLFALLIMYVAVTEFGATNIGGLFSPEYVSAPWSLRKAVDFLQHVWIPVLVLATAGTAEIIRVVRARMLDVMGQPFIYTARMKGISETRVVLRHALRVAINPVISGLGMNARTVLSGAVITSVVLALPLIGPLLLEALLTEDMYLAADILLLLTVALVVGNFFADLILAWLDPRIHYG
jgi:peptide/nickel transport system permease protein